MDILGLVIVGCVICSLVGASIGKQKGRESEGFWFGFFLGPFGCIIAALQEPTGRYLTEREAAIARIRKREEDAMVEAARVAREAAADAARSQQAAREEAARKVQDKLEEELRQWQRFDVIPKSLSTEAIRETISRLRGRIGELEAELSRRSTPASAVTAVPATVAPVTKSSGGRATTAGLAQALDAIAADPNAFPSAIDEHATVSKKST